MLASQEIIEAIGIEKFNKLIEGQHIVRIRERILFWQASLLEEIEEKLNCTVPKTPEEYLDFFSKYDVVEIELPKVDLREIEKETNVTLPQRYFNLIDNLDNNIKFYFNDYKDLPNFEGRLWALKSPQNLKEEIKVFGSGKEPFHHCLGLFLSTHLEFTGENHVYTSTGTIPKERVFEAFVIGEDNGDYLYPDPSDNYSVWIFHHDGCDVKKVANSFDSWHRIAKKEEN